MTVRLTRQQLYDLVWSEAMNKLARQIGISDVAIVKHCRKANVPTPRQGYWNKRQAGRRVTRTPLPLRDLSTANIVQFSGSLTSELKARIANTPGPYTIDSESIGALETRFRKRLGKVAIPRDLSEPHPLVSRLLAKDEELRKKHVVSRFPWDTPKFDSPGEYRRLRMLNGLLLCFSRIDCALSVRGPDALELSVRIGDASIVVNFEQFTHTRAGLRGGSSTSSDKRLRLTLQHYEYLPGIATKWEDQDNCPLEDQATEIVVSLALAAETVHRSRLAEATEMERQREEEGRKAKIQQIADEERREREREAAAAKAKIDQLCEDARLWRVAAEIRAYVAAVAQSLSADDAVLQLGSWVATSHQIADGLDPITSGAAKAQVVQNNPDEPIPPDAASRQRGPK
jgi:hypothetical protein